ncbi:nucleoside kinase [Leptolinea tardivitalis]|uniref:Uridine kinase n=1 Tax=Leptolinea tardivitalis TaxID=229920 RepID=A0A0P6WJW6_9CHLR|nr:nucleoside kinase [Leptolinea tardivitalis]KPL69951.1 uridine kinase [Leptolinea tardivitalis]GAP20601.1 uridine kinase [Leptolinea tardivitalis]
MENESFYLTLPQSTVEVYLPDGRVIRGERGKDVQKFLRVLPEWDNPPIVGAIINDELRELTFPITIDARVTPVTMADTDGTRIYRRSLTFLLEAAFEELYPDYMLTIDHSVSSGGFFCQIVGNGKISEIDLPRLETRMREMVQQDIAFTREQVPLTEAIQYFKDHGNEDKVRLLKYRQKDTLVLYRLGVHRDYHHGYMVPSTGFLRWFAISPFGDGFVLQFPRKHSPKELLPMPAYPKLLNTFHRYGKWLNRLGIESLGALNDAIHSGRIREIILVSEALHEQQIAEIAESIVNHANQIRIVLIAGPSSSGKTTFSKRLSIQLLAQGILPFPVEIDNYFVDREKTPKDKNGEYDYEALGALNTRLFSEHLQKLIAGEEVQMPKYNFKTGLSEPGEIARLQDGQVIILEGIHGLNPQLLPSIRQDQTYRVYVSCLTQLNLDLHNRISTTDTRLLRRIVRDATERGYSAQQTIQRWDSVRRGEKLHIFPYQENADDMFNSALAYELSALKPLAEPLLRQVPFGVPEYIEAKRLLTFLDWFLPVDSSLIPDNSLLREFIGGSILHDFKLWEKSEQGYLNY